MEEVLRELDETSVPNGLMWWVDLGLIGVPPWPGWNVENWDGELDSD